MGEIVIIYKSITIRLTPRRILLDDAEVSWEDERPFVFSGIKLSVISGGTTTRILRIDLGNDVHLLVKSRRASKKMAVDYLNLYIDKEDGLSKDAEGILGGCLAIDIKHFYLLK